jgi:phosphatidate cytidylyltransferase
MLLFIPALFGGPSREKFHSLATTALGIFYLGVMGGFMIRIRYVDGGKVGETAALFAICVAKIPDVFAYFIGRSFGRTKLIPSVSPGKTVAGFVGGLVGAEVVTVGFALATPLGSVLPPRLAPAFAILFGLVSIAGDLVESLFKRSAELKDSARLFPTFGGVLDVVDSIVLTAPVVYASLIGLAAIERAQV